MAEPFSALLLAGATIGAGFLGRSSGDRGERLRAEELAFRREMVARRSSEIDKFRSDLASRRSQFASRFASLQDLAFKRFVPQTEAQFAGRGLQVTGGAFQSELAKAVAGLQAEQEVAQTERARRDLVAVSNARAGLATGLTASSFDPGAGEQATAEAGAFGKFFGQNLPGTLETLGSSFSSFLANRRSRLKAPRTVTSSPGTISEFGLTG